MTPSETPSPRPRIGSLASLTWQHLVNDLLANYLPGVLPALAAEGVPVILLGSLQTALTLGQLLQPVTGIMADRKGGRAFILVGPFISALALFGMAYSRTYPLLLLFAFITGIGSTIFHPQALSTARSLIGGRKGTLMSIFLIGGEFGRAIGPMIAGVLVTLGGMSHLAIMAVLVLLGLPWALKTVPRADRRPPQASPLNLRRHLWDALALLNFTSFRAAAILGVSLLLPVYWHLHGGTLVAADSLVTVLVGLGVLGNVSGGVLVDRVGPRWVLLGTTGVGLVLVAALTRVQGIWIWPVMGILGMALFSSAPVTMLLGQDIFVENPGLGSGIALGAGNAIGAILLLFVSYVADHMGLIDALWVVAGFLVISMTAIPRLAPRLGPRRAEGAAR